MFLALSPGAFNRACVAVGKSRVISSWQVAHSADPTNSAPGMLGGARMDRLVSRLLHESRMMAMPPPIPVHQKSLSWLSRSQ